jgi:hypothetical protein
LWKTLVWPHHSWRGSFVPLKLMLCICMFGVWMLSISVIIIPSPTKLGRDIVTLPSVRLWQHPCEHSRINILQWILTKLGTYLVLKRIWNSIEGMPRYTLPLFYLILELFRRCVIFCFSFHFIYCNIYWFLFCD